MHDYRYNPFLNALEPVAITGETHVIPTNSPFTIRLNEVPLKESPSTVSLTIGGVAGVEVAADPAAGEFRCDYTTGADQDDNWNTGLIQFNAADAGKKVVVNYSGMGTLASINAPLNLPAWAKYRGNGSDGDFVAVGGETISGIKQYKSFTIGAGLTVNVGADPLFIFCQGTVKIDGTLNGKGGNGGSVSYEYTAAGGVGVGGGGGGGGASDSETMGMGGKGSGGGSGGSGNYSGTSVSGGASYFPTFFGSIDTPKIAAAVNATPSAEMQSLLSLLFMPKAGGGGGSGALASGSNEGGGGGGGGTITLCAETVSNNGNFNVAGGLKSTATGSNNNVIIGGGGGGASIMIVARNIIINGTIDVSGGNAGAGKYSVNNYNGAAGWYKIFTGA